MEKHPYLIAFVVLASVAMIGWTIQVSYVASVEKTRLEMEAKKFKAEEGNKFKFGLTRDSHYNGAQKESK